MNFYGAVVADTPQSGRGEGKGERAMERERRGRSEGRNAEHFPSSFGTTYSPILEKPVFLWRVSFANVFPEKVTQKYNCDGYDESLHDTLSCLQNVLSILMPI